MPLKMYVRIKIVVSIVGSPPFAKYEPKKVRMSDPAINRDAPGLSLSGVILLTERLIRVVNSIGRTVT